MSCKNDITGGATPASFEPTIDYVVTKIPRFTFEKFPGANDRLTTQMKSVGEVMAIGRTFQESLQKALRSLEIGIDGLDPIMKLPLAEERAASLREELRMPGPNRICYVARCVPRRPVARRSARAVAHRSVVPRADRGPRRARRARCSAGPRSVRRASACARSSARASPTAGSRRCSASTRTSVRARAAHDGHPPGLQARRHLRRRVRDLDRLHVLDLRRGVRSAADRPQEDHDPRRRPEPHRPGHRVRLLLRARRVRAARGGLRDHHGQLQSRRPSRPTTTPPIGCTSSRSRSKTSWRSSTRRSRSA